MKELQVRAAGILGLFEGLVKLIGGHRNTQGGEVGEDLLTQVWLRLIVAVFLGSAARYPTAGSGGLSVRM